MTAAYRLDRVFVATPSLDGALVTFQRLLQATIVARRHDSLLRAKRATLQAGSAQLELLQPADGVSPIRTHLDRYGEGVYAISLQAASFDGLVAGLSPQAVPHTRYPNEAWIAPEAGLGVRLRLARWQEATPAAPGPVAGIWEVSLAVGDLDGVASRWKSLVGLPGDERFNAGPPLSYQGAGLLFGDDRSEGRIELCRPTDPQGAMARFLRKRVDAIYSLTIVARDLAAFEAHVQSLGLRHHRFPNGSFTIHPSQCHGMLLFVTPGDQVWPAA